MLVDGEQPGREVVFAVSTTVLVPLMALASLRKCSLFRRRIDPTTGETRVIQAGWPRVFDSMRVLRLGKLINQRAQRRVSCIENRCARFSVSIRVR